MADNATVVSSTPFIADEPVAIIENESQPQIELSAPILNGITERLNDSTVANNEATVDEHIRSEILAQLANSTTAAETPQTNVVAGPSEIDSNLIDIINSMESDRQKFIAHVRSKISNQETEFEKTKAENDRLKKRVAELEVHLQQNNITSTSGCATNNATPNGGNRRGKSNNKNGANDDDILTQAKMLLFEKTKICKQQEQQLAAYKAQVEATKEVLQVTKDMLCLRNIEHDHTEARLDTMDLKLKNERARQVLSEKKLEVSKKMYADLRAEYDIQSNIFKQLRAGYEEKISVLTKQLDALKP